MDLSIEQQIFDSLGKAKKVLIALPEHLTVDSAASGLALAKFLKKMDKDAEVVSAGAVPESAAFLPGIETVKPDVAAAKSLVIRVDTSSKKIDEISYETGENQLEIFLKAKEGVLAPEDVSFTSDKFPVDVIVTLECQSLESLGKLFERNADLLYETTKINIDNRAGNEYFGAINLVDANASSVAEILSSLFEKYEENLIDEDIATALLAGIITKTNSFQHARTTPRAFTKASELIALGGRQQEVIKHVFKTKSLPFLRLWGRALARLKISDNLPVAYSLLNANDFAKAETSAEDLPAVIKELLNNVSTFKILAVLSEIEEGETRLLAALHMELDANRFLAQLGGNGKILENGLPGPFKIVDVALADIPLADAERRFTEAVKSAVDVIAE